MSDDDILLISRSPLSIGIGIATIGWVIALLTGLDYVVKVDPGAKFADVCIGTLAVCVIAFGVYLACDRRPRLIIYKDGVYVRRTSKVMRWADIKSLEIRDIQDIGQCLEILAANESAIVYDWQVDLSLTRIRQALVCRMEEVGENVIR